MTYAEAVTQLDALYATLPRVACQRQCQESCGIIIMTRVEWRRIQRQRPLKPKFLPDGTCPLLKAGACSVYRVRPLICRLWSLSQDPRLRCPWGCEPERWMTDEEVRAAVEAAEAIARAVFPGHESAAYAQGLTMAEIVPAMEAAHRRWRGEREEA